MSDSLCRCVRFFSLLAAIFLFPWWSTSAAVSTESGVGQKDAVYVVGNPDLYPVEYRSPTTGKFEGMLPRMLEAVSASMGIQFVYINGENPQDPVTLLQNKQAAICSAYVVGKSAEGDFTLSDPILHIRVGEEELPVCMAFSSVATPELISGVIAALKNFSPETKADLAVAVAMDAPPGKGSVTMTALLVGAIVLLTAMIATLALLHRRQNRRQLLARMTDPVTGMGNRTYFRRAYHRYIPKKVRAVYFLLYLRVDIRSLRRTRGNEEAKQFLRTLGGTLSQSCPSFDISAYLGGGSFVIAHYAIHEEDVVQWLEPIISQLEDEQQTEDSAYFLPIRWGVYPLTAGDEDVLAAIEKAKSAYAQGEKTHQKITFTTAQMLTRGENEMALRQQLHMALEQQQFRLYLQLCIDAKTEKICGAEALARWQHPTRGLLSPGEFIYLLEGEDKIRELDLLMFSLCCRQLEEWDRLSMPGIFLTCNFSRRTFCKGEIGQTLRDIAEKYAFDRSRLVVEITEDTVPQDVDILHDNCQKARDLGFRIALDDIGNGYTSFSDLSTLPADMVKLDRNFLLQSDTPRGRAVLSGLIAMVRKMGMTVVAEGVEDPEKIQLLRELSVEYFQGYSFYPPMPAQEATHLLGTDLS